MPKHDHIKTAMEAARLVYLDNPHDLTSAKALAALVLTAKLTGAITDAEALAVTDELLKVSKSNLSDEDKEVAEIAESIVKAAPQMPLEAAMRAAEIMREKGLKLEAVAVIEVDGGGVATIRTAPDDGIGNPVGNA